MCSKSSRSFLAAWEINPAIVLFSVMILPEYAHALSHYPKCYFWLGHMSPKVIMPRYHGASALSSGSGIRGQSLLSADARIVLVRIKIERAKKHRRDLAADVLATERRTVVIRDGKTQSVENPADAVTFKFAQGLPS